MQQTAGHMVMSHFKNKGSAVILVFNDVCKSKAYAYQADVVPHLVTTIYCLALKSKVIFTIGVYIVLYTCVIRSH